MRNTSSFLFALILSCNTLLAQNNPAPKIDWQTKNSVISTICKTLERNYVYPEKARSMCEYLKEQNAKGIYDSLSDPHQLAGKISKDIRSVYNDNHIRIEYDPQLEKDILHFLSSKKDAQKITQADIAKDEKKNFHFKKLEILPSNTGYIEFTGFAGPGASTSKTIQAAMQFVAHTDALIIDLRNNYGGNGNTANEIASYFFNTKTYTGKSFDRIENKWTEQYIENKRPITTGLVLNMPVYILTSNRTFSAAEGLAYTLQTTRNAVIIGDTTRGGAHLTRSFSLGNGFVGFIPFTRIENVTTKTGWEGKGVIPSIATEEFNSLLTAQNTILDKKLSGTTNKNEKRKIIYMINYNKSKNSSITISSSDAAKFTGRFAEFEITVQQGQLFFRDTNQPVFTYKKMIPVTSSLFQAGNDYQVEFIIENNICNSIKMYWDDGYEEEIKRTIN